MEDIKSISEIDSFTATGKMRMLYLSRPDCGVCVALIPKVEKMIKEFPEMEARYVSIDELRDEIARYHGLLNS